MDIKHLLKEFRKKLEDDLWVIGGKLTEFDPDTRRIEVEVFPDVEQLRNYASLLIKDALEEYLEKREVLLREENPFIGLVRLYNKNIEVKIEPEQKPPTPPHCITN